MPVRYEISENLLKIILEGSYTQEDIINVFLSAIRDPSLPKNARALLDVRNSLEFENRSSTEIRKIAEHFVKYSERFGHRGAVVASKPVHYGLARLGATHAGLQGTEIKVFTNLNEAVNWLNETEIS